MFSNILKLQAFFEKFKKNKGLFFSTLSTGSIIIIVLAMLYLNTVATRTASTFYEQSRVDVLNFVDDQLISKSEKILPISVLLANDQDLIDAMNIISTPKDMIATADVNTTDTNATINTKVDPAVIEEAKNRAFDIIKSANDDIAAYSTSGIDMAIYNDEASKVVDAISGVVENPTPTTRASIISVLATNEAIVGIEQIGQTSVLRAITPILSGGNLIGMIEVRQGIGFVQDSLNDQGYNFIFALDRFKFPNEFITNLNTIEINDRYVTVQNSVDQQFLEYLKDVNYQELMEDEYLLDSDFFVTYKLIQDVEGVNYGVMLIGENMDNPTNVLEVVSSVAKNITIVALGLVVALLILMI
jgi:hypothetical protein